MLRKTRGIEVRIEPGGRGQFDVEADGKRLFSKHEKGRFPVDQEILDALPK